ncbi:MAG: galactose-1-phosphate uridylyltransferase [Bdellovibrionia bacterium]
MYKLKLKKPDGRDLFLYSQKVISNEIVATSPQKTSLKANPHFRWHPLRGEWVSYASHRQNRTFFPPKEYNPLLPTSSLEYPTELPAGDYDIAVFENLFPSMTDRSTSAPDLIVPSMPGTGVCEVVVFAQDPTTSLSQFPLKHIELLVDVWSDRHLELGKREHIQYVMPFENKGVEVGVTLHHPHGQIYAYPFIPPIPARELELSQSYLSQHGRGLLEDLVQNELKEKRRILFEGNSVVAFVPAFARYPYEVWVVPRRRLSSVADMNDFEKLDFARALKTVTMKYDGLWKRPFPYLMVFHQAPTDGRPHPEAHFHVEFYPPNRSSDRLKYLAGTELGAGMFANDNLPEEKAAELQRIEVQIEE